MSQDRTDVQSSKMLVLYSFSTFNPRRKLTKTPAAMPCDTLNADNFIAVTIAFHLLTVKMRHLSLKLKTTTSATGGIDESPFII